MKIMASNVNQRKIPTFNAHLLNFEDFAEIIPEANLDEFQEKVYNIMIDDMHPSIILDHSQKEVETGLERKVYAACEGFDESAPFVIGKNMHGEKIFESCISAIGNAVEKLRKAF